MRLIKQQTVWGIALALVAGAGPVMAQRDLGPIVKKTGPWRPGLEEPVLVSLSGFTGDVASTIQFDLYVQGFKFVPPAEAEFQIIGSNAGAVEGRVKARVVDELLLGPKRYVGGDLRRQAHTFTDEIVMAVRGEAGIANTRIACKVDRGTSTEIFVSEFDGRGAQSATGSHDTLFKSPAWGPDRKTLFYTSFMNDRAEIIRLETSTGNGKRIASYGGSNHSPSPSPDGSKVAMILSKTGTVDLYVANADGSDLKQLTRGREDESSPCWSPDGRWIYFATKAGGRKILARISPNGGEAQQVRVSGVANPTEPDCSPDGKWIAFTAQMGSFQLCVVPADGGEATVLVAGDDPSWAPNSRTLAFTREVGYRKTLSLLDVPTKQFKDVPRISGVNNSQPTWAR